MNTEKTIDFKHDFIIREFTYAGFYKLGGENGNFHISLGKKPIWIHRKLMKLCLGWEWVDYKEL
jgi:heterodisulfide reductase subunit A-like polyferredoxin